MHLNMMSLKFSGPQAALEPLYKKHHLRSTLFLVRISFFLGALLYGLFGILDALVLPEQKHITWLIRYAIVCPGLLLVVAATYVPRLYPYLQPILFFMVTVGGLGIVLMVLVAPEPISHYYYAGLILVLMFGYAFAFLQFLWASLAGLLIVVFYNAAAVWSATPGTILISNNFFLVSANFAGMLICYVIEYMSRHNFFLMRQIEESKDQLEERITERTADLEEANRKLSRKIREHEKAVEALRQSESKYRLIAEGMNDFIWTCDTKLGLTYVSQSVERLYGFSPEERMTQTLGEMMTPASRKKALKTFVQEMAREKTKQADPHRSISLELEYYRKDGSAIFVETAVTCIHDQHGTLIGLNGVDRDITSRKLAESDRKKLQAQLNQAQKMESVGRLAGGVAHDFNNKLTIINGYAEMAIEMIDPSDPLHKKIQEIYTAGKKSADIVRQLLAFARKQTISPVLLDLNDTIPSMLNMLQRLIGENVELVWHPGKNLWPVKIDPSQVDQIMANLAVNARDAITDVGKIIIETTNIEVDEEYCTLSHFVPGQYVMLTVSDNGSGMDKETLENLFEPFFTTKEIGKGTGLGLATVYGIVKQNNGFINVYSEPGMKTTFKIYLPRHEGKESSLKPAITSTGQVPTGTETILVVEDEKGVLHMSRRILERLGYTVQAAGKPSEALRLSAAYEGTIHLLLTDVVMPEMNGRNLASKLTMSRPGLKTLYMSSYTENVIAHTGVLDPDVLFIQKPLSRQALAVKVREAIAQG